MTEQEWLECADAEKLLRSLPAPVIPRKLRLYGCACVRAIWPRLCDPRSQGAIETVERYVDGRATSREVDDARDLAAAAARRTTLLPGSLAGRSNAEWAAWSAASVVAWEATNAAQYALAAARQAEVVEDMLSSRLVLFRDIFGNPFRPHATDPLWLLPTIQSLAAAAYEERILPSGHLDPARLGVLSDALEEAGCAETGILNHLRSPGPHVRGCWAVDLLLGKS